MSGSKPSQSDILLAARSMIHHYGPGAAMRPPGGSTMIWQGATVTRNRTIAAIEKLQAEKPARRETVQ
jgi:hypothetical protein